MSAVRLEHDCHLCGYTVKAEYRPAGSDESPGVAMAEVLEAAMALHFKLAHPDHEHKQEQSL